MAIGSTAQERGHTLTGPLPRLIRSSAIVAQTGIDRSTLYRALERGEIASVRIGRTRYIRADVLDRLLGGGGGR